MSRRVTVNFEALAIENEVECEVALEALQRIDRMIERLDKIGEEIGENKIRDYKRYLVFGKNKIVKRVEKARAPFEEHKKLKKQTFDFDIGYGGKKSKELASIYNKLKNISYGIRDDICDYCGVDIELICAMLENEIYNDGLEQINVMLAKKPEMETEEHIEKIEKAKGIKDLLLREMVYRELLVPASFYTKFENLRAKAERKIEKIINKRREQVIDFCVKKMKVNNINSHCFDDCYNVSEVYNEALEEIIRERVRNKAIKAIVKAIRETGFVVDTKNNIKLDTKRDVVKMVAKKPSGQIAEFEVKLDGKFMYHFDGYEGGTCANDIEPFIKVLDEIYGVHIVKQRVHHDEPLKELKHRQYFEDSNKGKQTLD